MQTIKLKFLGVTPLQGAEFSVFLLILSWALQHCSATALPVKGNHSATLTPPDRQTSAYNVLTVRNSEKVQLRQIGSRPQAFQQAIDECVRNP